MSSSIVQPELNGGEATPVVPEPDAASISSTSTPVPLKDQAASVSNLGKLANTISPVSNQSLSASIVQSLESFSYHAPEWKDHTELKEAWTANEHALGEAVTGAFEKQADVYVCLAKARAILSQRGDKDKYVMMREKAKIINPETGRRWTWSDYFESFRAQYNFNKCLRRVQMKLAEMAGKKRTKKPPQRELKLTAADKRKLVDAALYAYDLIAAHHSGGNVEAALKDLQKNLPSKAKLHELVDKASETLKSDEVAPKVHALPKPQVDAKILDKMAALLADVAEQIKGDLVIRVREMRAQLEKGIG